jgi:hypothetical protein
MRTKWVASVLSGVLFGLGAIAGCGGGKDGETHLANLPPPSEEAIAKAKEKAKTIALPKTRFSSAGVSKTEKEAAPTIQP